MKVRETDSIPGEAINGDDGRSTGEVASIFSSPIIRSPAPLGAAPSSDKICKAITKSFVTPSSVAKSETVVVAVILAELTFVLGVNIDILS